MNADAFPKLTEKVRRGTGWGPKGPMETNSESLLRYVEFENPVRHANGVFG